MNINETLPTVTVIDIAGNEVLVNQSDYDAAPENYKLASKPKATRTPKSTKVQMLVLKDGEKFIIVDTTGKPVDGFEPFDTEEAAKEAISAAE